MLNPGKQDTNRKESASHQEHPHSILCNFSSQNHKDLEGESSMELMLQMSTEMDKKQSRFSVCFKYNYKHAAKTPGSCISLQ